MIRRSFCRPAAFLDALILAVIGLFPAAASAQSGTWITTIAGTYNWSQPGNWQNGIIADGADNTADFTTAGLTGPMTVSLDSPRTIGALVFDNPTNNFNWSILGSSPLTLANSATGGPAIAVNEFSLTATVATPLAGTQGLTKTGHGTLTLTGTNTYSGGTTVANGTLAVNGDAALGAGPVTITSALAALNFTASTSTSKSFNLGGGTLAANGGANVTLNGSTVAGGYLAGAGTFSTSAAGAAFANVTSEPGVSIVSNSPADRFVNFTNSATLTVAAGVNTAGTSSTVNLNGFTNEGSGSITIGAASKINVANFESYGTLTLNPAVVGSGQKTLLTNVGNSALGFDGGSRTFIGTPATAYHNGNPSFVAGFDLHGQNLVIAGGLFVNNGFITDSVGGGRAIVDFGALLKGAGYIGVPIITQNGGRVQPGYINPGAASFGSLTLGLGGIRNYGWQINDARGTAGPSGAMGTLVRGWSQLQAKIITDPSNNTTSTGNLTWTATNTTGNRFNFALQTLLAPSPNGGPAFPGSMDNFHAPSENDGSSSPFPGDGFQSFVWPVITYQGTYTGPTNSAILTADTLFNFGSFVNPHPGTFTMQLDPVNKAIDLVYTAPVPEPGTLALTAFGFVLIRAIRRRGRSTVKPIRLPVFDGFSRRCPQPPA